MSDSSPKATPHEVRSAAIHECADQLAAELRGPFPTALREAAERSIGYLRTYAADCVSFGERGELAVDLADSLGEALLHADRPHGALREAQLAGARKVLRRAERELSGLMRYRHVR